MHRFQIVIAIIFAALVAGHVVAAEPTPPLGWRLPTKFELADDRGRDGSPARFAIAAADFNGDGIVDLAYILISTKFAGEGLWVYLSDGNKGFAWSKLSEIRSGKEYTSVPSAMGVEVVKPGVIEYVCFDDAKECNFGDRAGRPKLKLRDPALAYFRIESAASMFFWSKKHGRFLRVWLSD